ncbi:MAG: hypothetical protein ACOVP5_01815 [Chitinophagales bacterium]
MNIKNLLISTFVGFVAYYMLCGLFYQFVFTEIHPASEPTNMTLISIGCLFNSLLVGYIFHRWAHFTDFMSGLKAGGILGAILGVAMASFTFSNREMNMTLFFQEFIISFVTFAVLGGVIAFVTGKLSKTNG